MAMNRRESQPFPINGLQRGFTNSPPRFYRQDIQHRAGLLHSLGLVVDLAGDGRHCMLPFSLAARSRQFATYIVKAEITRGGADQKERL
jgi:hypothetical protein